MSIYRHQLFPFSSGPTSASISFDAAFICEKKTLEQIGSHLF
jgi:hypothetical protein